VRESGKKYGFTRVGNDVFDIILPTLSTVAQSVFMRIYRQTWGWNKPADKIATSHFQRMCNIKDRETVRFAIEELEELDLITAKGKGTQVKEFEINMEAIDLYRQRYEMKNKDEK
jgi:phage replication O-like protein O